MRRKKPTRRLALEQLEDRWCPSANFTLDKSGTLTIQTDNTPQNISIVATATAAVSVQINSSPAKTFTGVTNITVNTGNANDSISFDTTVAGLLGNFTLNTGGSGFQGTGDSVFFSGGNSILGNVSLTNADTLFLNSVPIGGNLNINDSAKGAVSIQADLALMTIGGSLNFTGGGGLGSSLALTVVTVNGSVNANLGPFGNNPGGGYSDLASIIHGNLTVSAGGGNKAVSLSSEVDGSVAITLGTGQNSLDFANTATVGKNFTFTSGTSAPAGGGNVINGFQGFIGGNLAITLGNGLNTIGGVAGAFSPTVAGTAVTIVLGNGTNNTTIDPATAAAHARLTIVQGAGTNTLSEGSNSFKSGIIQFGSGTHTLTPPAGGFIFPVTIFYS